MAAEEGIGGSGYSSWVPALAFLIAALLSLPGSAGAQAALPQIILSSEHVSQGGILYLRVRVGQGETPRVSWMDREIPLAARVNGEWCGFLGVDLKSVPRVYPLIVMTTPSGLKRSVDVRVEGKDYGERRITLPPGMVDLDGPTLERVKREADELKTILEAPPAAPLWNGPFRAPVEGEITGLFGLRNFINGQPRSPHSGVDLKANLGMPVKAMNDGRVVFIADQFFSGLSVVIDHGGAIHSMYFHLDKILVKEQQQVRRGELIGHVGSTGRSTGPHLHLGIRINGARVDPFRLIGLSKELE